MLLSLLYLKRKIQLKIRKRRRCWLSKLFANRESDGYQAKLLPVLKRNFNYKLKDFLRFDKESFYYLLDLLKETLEEFIL